MDVGTALIGVGVLACMGCAALMVLLLISSDHEDTETDHADEGGRVAPVVRHHGHAQSPTASVSDRGFRMKGYDSDTFI